MTTVAIVAFTAMCTAWIAYRFLLVTGEYKRLMEPRLKTPSPILKYFTYEHLREPLVEVSKPICELATLMELTLPDGPEKSAGLRKLLEAKDCFVRARVG